MHVITSLVYVPIITTISIIAIATFLYRTKKYVGYFSLLIFVLSFWLLLQYLAQMHFWAGSSVDLTIIRLSSAVSGFIGYFFLLFTLSYGHGTAAEKFRVPLIVIPMALVPFNFTNAMISRVQASFAGIEIQQAGNLYIVQILIVLIYLVTGVGLLIRQTIRSKPQDRVKNHLLLWGTAQAVLAITFGSLLFAKSASAQSIIPLSVLIMILIISIAIIRHGLFNFRLLVARSLGYVLALVVLIGLFGGVILKIMQLLTGQTMSGGVQFFSALSIGLAALSFDKLKRMFDRVTNKYFYRDSYDPQVLFDTLNRYFVTTLDINKIASYITRLLRTTLKSQTCYILVQTAEGAITSRSAVDLKIKDINLPADFISILGQHSRTTIFVDTLEDEKDTELKDLLVKNHIDVAVRLRSNFSSSRIDLGYLLLGPKQSGNPYAVHDGKVLDTVAQEIVLALQNAFHYEEIQQFNETLQGKVEDATRKLKVTNEKLKRMDETKDEFISMASHQLRTPLTSVKGYISMVLDGDVGPINHQQRELLNQSFQSSQRMANLISDLLNLSRINTGKFVIESSPVYLPAIIETELQQLREMAQGKQIELKLTVPPSFPTLMLDDGKMHQAVMNLVDNAIYYTPAGGRVEVQLIDTPNTVEFRVVDTGIGVPRDAQRHLFGKMFRAENARRARPDGTGLGLFMVKKVVVEQQGAIIFETEENKGSTFGFRFNKKDHLVPESDTPTPAQIPA